jgi:aquaporin Z
MYAYMVEFLGTALLLGAVAFSGNPALILAALGIAIGLGGKISGGHFNPAVSFWAYMTGKLSGTESMYYIGAQYAAGLLIALLYNAGF